MLHLMEINAVFWHSISFYRSRDIMQVVFWNSNLEYLGVIVVFFFIYIGKKSYKDGGKVRGER